MTWDELITQLQAMPEERRKEKAVFVADHETAWEIDAVSHNTESDEQDIIDILEENSIWDTYPFGQTPITLTP